MTIAGSALGLIRAFFNRDRIAPQPPSNAMDLRTSRQGAVGPSTDYNSYLSGNVQVNGDLMSKFADYEDMASYPELGCIAGDSIVRTLEGPIPIAELCSRYPNGEIFKIFAYDRETKEFVIADAHHPRKTKTDAVIELVFDNGTSLKCTPDHKILRRDGVWIEAAEFKIGQSVMPLETRLRNAGYLRLCHPEKPDNCRWESVYKLVARMKFGKYDPILHVHHIDKNKLNDSWDNLQILTREEHAKCHASDGLNKAHSIVWTENRRRSHVERMKAQQTDDRRAAHSEAMKNRWAERSGLERKHTYRQRRNNITPIETMLTAVRQSIDLAEAARKLQLDWTTLCRRLKQQGVNYQSEVGREIVNHKIVAILKKEAEDVYDLTTDRFHNFVANGVVVHNSALNIYADEATQQDVVTGRSLWFECDDQTIESILDFTFHHQLKIEQSLWEMARALSHMGNMYEEIVVYEGVGVVKLINQKTPLVRRMEDPFGNHFGFIADEQMQFAMNTEDFLKRLQNRNPYAGQEDAIKVFEPWELAHFRLRGQGRDELYGESILEPARWVWKRLQLMEDAMVLYKLTRSPQRFVFYVDTGDVPPNEAKKIINQVKQDFKKQKFVDPQTGKISFRFNPLCLALDTRVPLLNGKTKTITDLISDHDAGIQNYVYSIDPQTRLLQPGTIKWAGVTRRDAQVVKVTLDNCQEIICTPDHRFLLRDGTYIEAQHLEPGTPLMPLYRGITRQGYEYGVHQDHRERGPDKWKSLIHTHKMVARHFHGDLTGFQVHHIDENTRNNYPDNLVRLTPQEHHEAHKAGRSVRIRAWNSTADHSRQVTDNNRKYNKGVNIVRYNESPQHAEDNKIRSKSLKSLFETRGDEMRAAMRIKFPEGLLPHLRSLVQENPKLTLAKAAALVDQSELAPKLWAINSNRKACPIQMHHLLKAIRESGLQDWKSFKYQALNNHKVASVEFLDERMDVGCLTVDSVHNFGLEFGCFVHNSVDEDFFISKRRDKRSTEIDILSGLDGQQIDDATYFREKLFAALSIPKSYLGADETISRSNLGQMDIRFCKTVMRIQREMKNGLRQIANVDLASRNIDPDKVDFDLKMVVPSGALEVAHIEVLRAKADLAAQYQSLNFSEYYIWSQVMGLSDDDIQNVQEQRAKEQGALAPADGAEPAEPGAEPPGGIDSEEPIRPEDIQSSISRRIDRSRSLLNRREMDMKNRILDDMGRNQNKLSRGLNDLRSLAHEIKNAASRRRPND